MEKLQEITEYAFTREELFSMEKHLLMKLDYRLAMPTRDQFALYYSRHFHFTSRQQQLLSFLILLSFLDYNFNCICMSQVAAAASLLVLQVNCIVIRFFILAFLTILFILIRIMDR